MDREKMIINTYVSGDAAEKIVEYIDNLKQRAESAEARAAERDAWAIGWKKYAKIMRRRVMELCHSVAQKDTPLIRRVIELEHDNAELQAEVERLRDISSKLADIVRLLKDIEYHTRTK